MLAEEVHDAGRGMLALAKDTNKKVTRRAKNDTGEERMIKLKALIEVVRDKVPPEGECAGWWQNHESEEGDEHLVRE